MQLKFRYVSLSSCGCEFTVAQQNDKTTNIM